MRIAYVTETYPPDINGVALTVAHTLAHLRAEGHVVDLIRPRQPAEPRSDGPLHWLSSGASLPLYRAVRFGWALPATLARRFAQTRPHLVHVATPGPLGWAAVTAARRLGIVCSSDFRTNFHQYAGHYGLGVLAPAIARYLRWFHNRTQCTFVPTRQGRRSLQAQGFEQLAVVGRGVDTQRFAPGWRSAALRAQWRAQWRAQSPAQSLAQSLAQAGAPPDAWPAGAGPAADDAPVLLHVGRLAAEKNVDLALRAADEANRQVPGTRIVVVGDGPRRQALQRAHPQALFVGMQHGQALAAHYASADVFVFPSQSDTFGNVTLEALASGLPVVAFDLAAAYDHVADGVSGHLLQPADDAGFCAAVCRLAALGTGGLAPLREQARQAALAATWPRVLQPFEQRLLALVQAHGAARAPGPLRHERPPESPA